MNRTLKSCQIAIVALSVIVLLLAGLALYHGMAGPIVVMEREGEKQFYNGVRRTLKITDNDVKRFIEEWITLRYTWSDFDPEQIVRAIAPVSTEGFQGKLREVIGKRKTPNSQGTQNGQGAKDQQKLEETVTNIKVSLGEKEALASFDQILRINGIPLIVPSQVSLQIIQGGATKWNPLGLYVDGIIEHEEK